MASSQIQQPVKAAAEGSVKNLRTDPDAKVVDGGNVLAQKDGSVSDVVSCISSADAATSSKESDAEHGAMMPEPGMYYPANGLYGYYYPGFDGSFGGWDAQSYYVGSDGLEIHNSVSQGDNGSVLYYFPGFQPDYAAYSPFMHGSMVNVDGQYLGQQLYYPSSMFSQPFVSPGLFPQSVTYAPDLVPSYSWDSSPFFADGTYASGYGDPSMQAPKPNFSSQSHMHAPAKTLFPLKSATSKKGSSPAVDLSPNAVTQNQSFKPINKAAPMISKGFLPTNKVPSYTNQGKSGIQYPHRNTGIKETARSWVGVEKLKARNMVQETGSFDMLNEQNRGPRTNGAKNTWNTDVDSVGTPGDEVNDISVTLTRVVSKDTYNLLDFSTKYDHAFFFVIKSYSEDDIHKSIKYNVWASTPSGNKRLDGAFQVAQEKMAEKGSKHPVFLFFSVNASGQFCGVAEMIGRVDFTKNMDFWQQDKWTGYFPVKWHIIKDVPNPQFRHIILENNENKPVTNSRDTQEVKFLKGTEMLNIFKNYASKTSILDDFNFYENRQKAMQDKRIKHSSPNLEQLSPKADGENLAVKPGDLKSIVSALKSLELASMGTKEQLLIGDEVE